MVCLFERLRDVLCEAGIGRHMHPLGAERLIVVARQRLSARDQLVLVRAAGAQLLVALSPASASVLHAVPCERLDQIQESAFFSEGERLDALHRAAADAG